MSKVDGLEEARKHIVAAFKVLNQSGWSRAEAYEHITGVAMEIWSHGMGYVMSALSGVM